MPVSKTNTECEKYIPGFNQETLAYISVLIIISHVIILSWAFPVGLFIFMQWIHVGWRLLSTVIN